MAYTSDGMYSQPQLGGVFELGDIFDDINKIAGKVGGITDQVREITGQASDVAAGRKKVAVIPTSGGFATIPVPGQPYGVTIPLMPILLGGGALVLYLMMRKR